MDPKLEAKLAKLASTNIAFECTWDGKPAAVGFSASQLHVVRHGWGNDASAPLAFVQISERGPRERRVMCYGMDATVAFQDAQTATMFDAEAAKRQVSARIEAQTMVAGDRMVTTAELPGFRITQVVGAVSELSATSGLTATMKGNDALDDAMTKLRRTAFEAGANAVVGLTASVFGAKGGVTSAFGGDAVGVLLMGTAVVVEASDPALNSSSPAGH